MIIPSSNNSSNNKQNYKIHCSKSVEYYSIVCNIFLQRMEWNKALRNVTNTIAIKFLYGESIYKKKPINN